jgi:hypothetical protein
MWLRCDPSPRRPARIRYAVTKLAAGLTVLSRRTPQVSLNVINPLVNALNGLIGPAASGALLQALAGSSATDVPRLEDVAGVTIDGAIEGELTSLKRTCCPCIDQCFVGPSAGESLAEFTVSVNRSPGCLFHVVDPQCWTSTAGGFFNDAFILGNAPTCTGTGSTTPVCRSGPVCGGSQPTPLPLVSPSKAGTPWCGLVFEDVTADASGNTAQFKNVLQASLSYVPAGATATSATGFRMDYGLCESIFWEICDTACQSGSCPLDRDCGHAEVMNDGTGRGLIDGSKHINFAGAQPIDGNKWAPLALEVMVKETALAACELAADCPAAATPAGCNELPGPETCTCVPLQDHCEAKEFLEQRKPTTLCGP